MKKTSEINIRDPFVLPWDGKYYLYGTRGETCWGLADGFDVYVGTDLENWEGPIEMFHAFFGAWVRGRGSKPPAQKGESSHGTHTNSRRFPAGRAGHACDLRAVCGAYRRQL